MEVGGVNIPEFPGRRLVAKMSLMITHILTEKPINLFSRKAWTCIFFFLGPDLSQSLSLPLLLSLLVPQRTRSPLECSKGVVHRISTDVHGEQMEKKQKHGPAPFPSLYLYPANNLNFIYPLSMPVWRSGNASHL